VSLDRRRLISAVAALGVAAAGLTLGGPAAGSAVSTASSTASTSATSSASASRSTAGASSAAGTCSSTPFRSNPSQRTWFRIPAVVRTGAGTLVAFAERRDNNDTSDLGNYDIVTARSTDRGCTWSAYRVIGSDAANRVSTPVPIVDATTGDLLLFSVITARPGSGGTGKGLYLQTSTDDGLTFSALLEHPVRPDGGYKGGLSGPGHGIQLTVTHPGRLILPLGYRAGTGLYGAYAIYSDDHGTTWHNGFHQQDATGTVKYLEGTIAELPAGDLFISFRDKQEGAKTGAARKFAISKDGGASLSSPFTRLPLNIVSVQGSALVLTGTQSNRLLFSAPADPTVTLRRDMTIFVSATSGTTWGKKYQVELESTPGAYSDLVQVDDGTVGVLYETGVATWKERIAFRTIAITALTKPVLVASRLSYRRSTHPTKSSARAKIKATVTVSGIGSPPGRVTLKYAGNGRTRTTSVQLTYSNRGARFITLPKLKKGSYRLTLTYSGTGRIAKATRSAGTLRVVN
jgi:sialidase-1